MNIIAKIKAASSVPTPATGYVTLFVDSADGSAKIKDSTGAVTTIVAGGGGGGGAVDSVNGQTGVVVLDTSDIAEVTNLYFTNARARASVSAGTGVSYDNLTGVITNASPDQVVSLTGTGLAEITGTYPSFTVDIPASHSHAITDVTGLQGALDAKLDNSDAGVALGVATLDGAGKVPTTQLPDSVLGGLNYQGTWNASTNTPSLSNGTGSKGHYYKVGVAGSTSLDGISQWTVGDMVAFNGATWDKIEGNANDVISVAGKTGEVTLTTSDVAEGTNLYFTDVKARASLSAGTGIGYDNVTGEITNSSPDQVIVLTPTGGASVSGTYPNFTVGAPNAVDLASPPVIGGTTPNAITGTTITGTNFVGGGAGLTGTATALSIGGNAETVTNGVYTNAVPLVTGRVLYTTTGGKVVDSTALTFNGTNLATTGGFSYGTTLTGGTGAITIGTNHIVKLANGKVGIGNASPSDKFHVSTATYERQAVFNGCSLVSFVTRAGAGCIQVGGADSSALMIDYNDASSTVATIKNTYMTASASALMRFASGTLSFATGTTPLVDTVTISATGLINALGGLQSIGAYNATTASAANVFITATGVLQRSTSSIKYKRDVVSSTKGLAEVMKLRSVNYKSKSLNEDGTPNETLYGGLIAEEVDEAGLNEFVAYGEDGKPDAIHYGHMVSLAFKAIQEQQAIIESLKARVDSLVGSA